MRSVCASGFSRRRFLAVSGPIVVGVALAACGGMQKAVGSTSDSSSEGTTMATEFPPGVQVFGPEDGDTVLVLHPWWGISPGVLDWRDALVAAGARVVLPDLYGGTAVDTILEAEAMSNAVDDVAAFALLDACADQLNAAGRPWSALGWSMGASYASQMMSRGDHAPHRAVLFYGAAAPLGASRTEAVQLHIAPGDEYFTDEEIADVIDAFARTDITVERYDYPGLGHWFAEIGSPAYDEEGTVLAKQRALSFLGLEPGA